MTDATDGRGVLYPARLPTFDRVPAPVELADRIRWFWIPRWRLAPGRISRQTVLPFPASNLVVEPDRVSLTGPTSGVSHRDLEGEGWAVGALLRPAGIASLTASPSELRDQETPFPAPQLHQQIVAAMALPDPATSREGAVAAYVAWAHQHLTPADEAGVLANRMEDVIATSRDVVQVVHVAERLNVSTRTVQRLAHRYIGVPPLAMIRRYRLQEAAQQLRADPSLSIATVAANLGYADQAHLSADFRRILGLTPSSYRRQPAPDPG